MRKYREYTIEDLTEAVKTSLSVTQVLDKLNLKKAGGNYESIKRLIARNNLDVSHFTGQVWNKDKTLKELASYVQNKGRKKILIQERGHKCESCTLSEWMGLPIVLELHHIDGNRLNNDKENLSLLCCNCHAITGNWRNKKRK